MWAASLMVKEGSGSLHVFSNRFNMDTKIGLNHTFTNLVQCKALNNHTFGTVLSNCQRADISQQVSDLFIVNLQTTDVNVNRSKENNLSP